MAYSLLGSRANEIHHFTGSNANEILEFLRSSADASEKIQDLICEESFSDEDVHKLEQLLFDYHRLINLTNLKLPSNGLTSASGRSLAAILSLQHETLQGFSLAHNPFTSVGLNQILEPLFSHSPQATNLIHLDLTNTQLGSKGGLAIAQLLRNNNTLQQLNVTNNSIGTKGIKAIVSELTTNSSLLLLNLSYNNLKSRGATLLARALEESTSVCNLQSLILTGNSIGHKGMQTLSRMLTVDRTIESLYVGINNIGPEGAAHLAFAIKRNYTLRLLHINDNNIGPNAASLLFDQLRDDNRTLENLNLAGNNIGTQGASDLTAVFIKNAILTNIDLSGNRIGSDGVILLTDALPYSISLVHLNLSNNLIDDRGAQAISEVLSDPNSLILQTISLEDNPDISAEGLLSLSRAPQVKRNWEHWLSKFVQNLIGGKIHSINWTKRKIGNEEVLLLNKALNNPTIQTEPPTIRSLWLGGPLLTSRSLVPLFGTCISSPSNVVRLYIKDCCNTCEDSMEAIAEALPRSKSLEVLSLTSCCITPKGATKIAQGLRQNATLRRLNLDDNRIGDDGLAEIVSALPHKTLTSLSANGNNITDTSMGLHDLSQVDELHLKNNQITDRGALDFARNLMDGGCRMTWVSLQNNHVTKKGGETILTFMPEAIPGSAIVDY